MKRFASALILPLCAVPLAWLIVFAIFVTATTLTVGHFPGY